MPSERPDVTPAQVKRAIKSMDRAWKDLEPVAVAVDMANMNSGRPSDFTEVRTKIRELTDYLEGATWWKR